MPAAAVSWYHEKESAWLYRAVTAAEPDPARRALFQRLAATAEEQAARWLEAEPRLPSHLQPAFRPRVAAGLLRHVPPRYLCPQIALEREELAFYPEAEAEELALIYNARAASAWKRRAA
ncbi:MAG TPA: hypothetical protein VFO82_04185 [Steroidobacteraceae bacterium]|nr:hypothetical protein [Steroidobacteraceae bacterium]